MSRVVLALVIVAVLAIAAISPLAAAAEVSKEYTISFEDRIVLSVDSNISKVYSVAKMLGAATIEWKGEGSGYAYIDEDGVTKATIDLSRNGSISLSFGGGNVTIRLDSGSLWHGRITVTVQDTYNIRVTLSSNRVTLRPGGSATITMTIQRVSGIDRYVTFQYYAPSAITVSASPSPPWRVGSQTVRLTISASNNAYGNYNVDLYLAAYRNPAPNVPTAPHPPQIRVPSPRPMLPHDWMLAGQLSMSFPINMGSMDNVENAMSESGKAMLLVIVVALVAAASLLLIRHRR